MQREPAYAPQLCVLLDASFDFASDEFGRREELERGEVNDEGS